MKIKLYQWCLSALLIGVAFMLQNCQEEEVLIPEENSIFTDTIAAIDDNSVQTVEILPGEYPYGAREFNIATLNNFTAM